MEGDVTAAVTLEYFHAPPGQQLGRGHDVLLLAVAAESDDRRVFEQQQDIADAAFFAQVDEALLQAEAGGVVNRSELEDGDHGRLRN